MRYVPPGDSRVQGRGGPRLDKVPSLRGVTSRPLQVTVAASAGASSPSPRKRTKTWTSGRSRWVNWSVMPTERLRPPPGGYVALADESGSVQAATASRRQVRDSITGTNGRRVGWGGGTITVTEKGFSPPQAALFQRQRLGAPRL